MLRILVTNDDGIEAQGLAVLEKVARALSDDVWVIAPETQQSGAAHSVSLHRPIRFRELEPKRFAVSGTPTDCVIAALRVIVPEKIDLLLSGVNRGPNVADDVTHSGTVAAAMEGTLCHVPSIAFSQAIDFDAEPLPQVHWATAEHYARGIVEKLLRLDWGKDTFFNVNFPDCPPEGVQGIKCVAQGKHRFYKELMRKDEGETPAYWVNWADAGADPRRPDVDIHWLAERYITVTPLSLDLTQHALLAAVRAEVEA